jgi:hypothetical protein
MNCDWILVNPNRQAIEKVIEKRSNLIIDITQNGKYYPDYQRKLTRYSKQIERLYKLGLRKV